MNRNFLHNYKAVNLITKNYFNNADFIIIYGSKKIAADIDIFVIQKEPIPTPSFRFGKIDIFVTSENNFTELLNLWDPIVTEPILTGELIKGKKSRFNSIKKQLKTSKPEKECFVYLSVKSMEQTLSVENLLKIASEDPNSLELHWIMQNLSFAISYMSFAKYYENKLCAPCTLKDLIIKKQIYLPKFWEYRQSVKDRTKIINLSLLNNFFRLWIECIVPK